MDGLAFSIPMLFVTLGTAALGGAAALVGWINIVGQWRSTAYGAAPRALSLLTASVLVVLACFAAFLLIPAGFDGHDGHLVWTISFTVAIVLNCAALVLSRERNAARVAVRIGAIAVGLVHVLGVVLFYWGG